MNYLQNITDTVSIGEKVMHWIGDLCIISEVIGKGFHKGKHALIVRVGDLDVYVTEIV